MSIQLKIEHHEDVNRTNVPVTYGNLARRQRIAIPLEVLKEATDGTGLISARIPPDSIVGTINAEVNDGIWRVKCTNDQCASGNRVSELEPFFICVECGSPDVDSKWRTVVFPRAKKAIEVELMKRPRFMRVKTGPRPQDGFHLVNRNWVPGETVADLKKQRAEMNGDA